MKCILTTEMQNELFRAAYTEILSEAQTQAECESYEMEDYEFADYLEIRSFIWESEEKEYMFLIYADMNFVARR